VRGRVRVRVRMRVRGRGRGRVRLRVRARVRGEGEVGHLDGEVHGGAAVSLGRRGDGVVARRELGAQLEQRGPRRLAAA